MFPYEISDIHCILNSVLCLAFINNLVTLSSHSISPVGINGTFVLQGSVIVKITSWSYVIVKCILKGWIKGQKLCFHMPI